MLQKVLALGAFSGNLIHFAKLKCKHFCIVFAFKSHDIFLKEECSAGAIVRGEHQA